MGVQHLRRDEAHNPTVELQNVVEQVLKLLRADPERLEDI